MSSPSSSNTSNSLTPSSSSSIPPTTPFTDHYAILGISPTSHSQTSHTAYKTHLSTSHPRNFHPNTFTSQFILSKQAQWEKIVRAKDILSNPVSRAVYDAKYEEAKMMEEEEEGVEMRRQQQGERKNSRSVEEWMERINALVGELAMVGEENVRLREEGKVLKKDIKGREEEMKRLRGEGEEGVWDLDFL